MSTVTLFKKCLGLNDARAFGTQKMIINPRDPELGSVELIDCLNLTTTPDGCVEKLPPMVTALDTGSAVTALSAGSRLLFSDGINTKELTPGSTVVNRFPAIVGPIAHTNIDCRVSTGNKVYRSRNNSPTMSEALVEPAVIETTKPYYGQPTFTGSFAYNTMLYGVDAGNSKFIRHSSGMEFNFDAWYLGDHGLYHAYAVLQAGAIPGVVLATHAEGVTVWSGSGPHDFVRRFYPCAYIPGTLYSGFISKVYGYAHVFLCDDGVYVVGPDGALVNLTVDQIDHVDTLNTSYSCSTVAAGKYLAFGDSLAIEYDFKTKSTLKRSTFGIAGACVWNGVNYFASGHNIVTAGTEIDTTGAFECSMTLPFSDLGAPGTKSFEALYFTGTLSGDMTITATDQTGRCWEKEVSDLGTVSNYRIKTPKGMLGNHISIKIECPFGAFRLEELRATFAASKRSR